ncbi:MAG: hypothetical protein ABIP68_00835 [Ferruginibacter sp.]
MNTDISKIIPQDFNDNSRVWIYQNSASFNNEQINEIESSLNSFIKTWNAHGSPVKGFAKILFNKFIIIMADETATLVSGCSTDSFQRKIKEIQQNYNVDLFNRLALTFILNDELVTIDLNNLENSISKDQVNVNTPYFNNTVLTKRELMNNWIIPAGNSWLNNYFSKSHSSSN